MRTVKITIDSVSGDNGHIGVVAYGHLAERDGKYYAMYKETSLSGMEGTNTTLKWDKDSLVVLRKGTFESRQEYRENYVCESVYKTPYMSVPIKAATKVVRVSGASVSWHLHVESDMEIGGEANGLFVLDIVIEEEKTSEH